MTFSIVIPACNGEKYIERAILSVLNQALKPDEIIIHDDNSTDSTRQICKKYFPKVTYYFNPDGPSGFVNGWKKAIALAKSDFIAILHQDDFLYPSFLKEAENALTLNPGVRHLFTLCDYIDENELIISGGEKSVLKDRLANKIIRYSGKEYVRAYQKKYNKMPHIHRCPGVITHRSIFDEGCNYDAAAGHIADDDLFYRVGQFTDVIGIMKSLASYRIHKESETGKIGDIILVRRLVTDYIYQVHQWQNTDFMDNESKAYFIKNVYKYKKRLLGYGIKLKDDKIIDEVLEISDQLKKENFAEKNKFIYILELLLRSKITSSFSLKILSLLI